MNEHERMRILEMIESGEIDASEGMRLLQTSDINAEPVQATVSLGIPGDLSESQRFAAGAATDPSNRPTEPEVITEIDDPQPPTAEQMRLYWMIPLWIGAGITALGGLLMAWALQATGVSIWFFMASLPFYLGVLVMALAWQSRDGHWLHLRIEENVGERSQRIAFSIPLPIRPTVWFLRNFGDRIPALRRTALDEVILALGNTTTVENPIYIEVNDEEDDERILIFIT
jgi:hypothetical protein